MQQQTKNHSFQFYCYTVCDDMHSFGFQSSFGEVHKHWPKWHFIPHWSSSLSSSFVCSMHFAVLHLCIKSGIHLWMRDIRRCASAHSNDIESFYLYIRMIIFCLLISSLSSSLSFATMMTSLAISIVPFWCNFGLSYSVNLNLPL